MKKKTPIRTVIDNIKEKMELAIKNRDKSTSQDSKRFWTGVHDGLDMASVVLYGQLENEKKEMCDFAREGAIDFYNDTEPTDRYDEIYEV